VHQVISIYKITYTNSECVGRTVIPQQQWSRECASVLHLYPHCMSCLVLKLLQLKWY